MPSGNSAWISTVRVTEAFGSLRSTLTISSATWINLTLAVAASISIDPWNALNRVSLRVSVVPRVSVASCAPVSEGRGPVSGPQSPDALPGPQDTSGDQGDRSIAQGLPDAKPGRISLVYRGLIDD